MKLAKIILPEWDNDRRPLRQEHGHLRHLLLKHWGGYTETHAMGGWREDPTSNDEQREPVIVYKIAMERADVLRLREVARQMCVEARQKCVMIVTPNGDVEFVKPDTVISAGDRPQIIDRSGMPEVGDL